MIKVVATDIDGVLTDGKVYVDANGNEIKNLCFQDFDSVSILEDMGIKLALVTGEDNAFVDYVRQKFRPEYVYAGCKNKKSAIESIMELESIDEQQMAYLGDGKYDVPVLKSVGLAFCPANAIPEAMEASDIKLKAKAGEGCLREVVDYIKSNEQSVKAERHIAFENCYSQDIKQIIKQHLDVASQLTDSPVVIEEICLAIDEIREAFKRGNRLLVCGNGGSAADSQHIVTEFVSRFLMERKALDAEALTVNTSSLTAIANDYEYSRVFARQVEAKGKTGDVIIGITTSGESLNVMNAFDSAKKMGMKTIAFVGSKSSIAKEHADIVVTVPSNDTPRIQEMHIMLGHIICELVEKSLFKKE